MNHRISVRQAGHYCCLPATPGTTCRSFQTTERYFCCPLALSLFSEHNNSLYKKYAFNTNVSLQYLNMS